MTTLYSNRIYQNYMVKIQYSAVTWQNDLHSTRILNIDRSITKDIL